MVNLERSDDTLHGHTECGSGTSLSNSSPCDKVSRDTGVVGVSRFVSCLCVL